MALLRGQRNYPVEQVEPLPIEIDHFLSRHWEFAALDRSGLVFDKDEHRMQLNFLAAGVLHDRCDLVQPHNLDILESYRHELT